MRIALLRVEHRRLGAVEMMRLGAAVALGAVDLAWLGTAEVLGAAQLGRGHIGPLWV